MTSRIRWEPFPQALKILAPTEVKRLAANIRRAAGRMRELLADLAGASSGSNSTFQICNIRHVIDAVSEAVLPIAERQGVRIVNEASIGLQIPLVRSRIERVFLNLIANALEAMPHGGEIRIGARQRDNGVLIEVEDTGLEFLVRFKTGYSNRSSPQAKTTVSDWGWRSPAKRCWITAATCGLNPRRAPISPSAFPSSEMKKFYSDR